MTDESDPPERPGLELNATIAHYAQGDVLIMRQKKSFTAWIASSSFTRLNEVR